jgi:predicted nucleic acid-binding protein
MYLLDINALLAFAYEEHVFHPRVSRWIKHVELETATTPRFATCSITELGFIRIAGRRNGLAENLTFARADLRRIKAALGLVLLSDELDGNRLPGWVMKADQTTDGHLMELAGAHHMQLATFDTGIPGTALIPEEHATLLMVHEPPAVYRASA